MADGIRVPSTPKMAMAKPYSNYQDIINGIAKGKVNFQNYEELLKALGIKDPTEYALTKRHIEEALKYSARNLNAQQANIIYPLIADTPNVSSGLSNIVKDINNTQAAKKQVVSPAGFVMPADTVTEIAPQVVQRVNENTVNPVFQGSGSDILLPNSPLRRDNIEGNDATGAPNVYSTLANISAILNPLQPQTSANPVVESADVPVTETLQSTPAPVNPRREAANHLYNIFNQPDTFEVTTDEPAVLPQTKKPAKTSKKQKSLQNLTESINIARPGYTNDAYSSQIQPVPVQPAEPPIDESYYRYLRNNGWNDFDARRQAIRYY